MTETLELKKKALLPVSLLETATIFAMRFLILMTM